LGYPVIYALVNSMKESSSRKCSAENEEVNENCLSMVPLTVLSPSVEISNTNIHMQLCSFSIPSSLLQQCQSVIASFHRSLTLKCAAISSTPYTYCQCSPIKIKCGQQRLAFKSTLLNTTTITLPKVAI